MKKSLNFLYTFTLLLFLGTKNNAMEPTPQEIIKKKSATHVGGIPLECFTHYKYLGRNFSHLTSHAKRQKKVTDHAQEIPEQKPFDPTDNYNHKRDYQHVLKAFTDETDALLPDLKRNNVQSSGGWFSKKEELLTEPKVENGITIVEFEKLTPAAQIAYRVKYDIVTRIAPHELTDAGEPSKTKVLYDQNTFVGFITYIRDDVKNGHVLFLYVDKNLRKKGYGRKLVEVAQNDFFYTKSINRFWVPLHPTNNAAINFYKKIGFSEVNDKSITKKDRVSWAIEKALTPAARNTSLDSDSKEKTQ